MTYSRFNSTLTSLRRANLNGIYDPHTNIMHYPKTMQPTHARWEQIDDHEAQTAARTNGTVTTTNGTSNHYHSAANKDSENPSTIFPPVKPIYSRNYMIIDTVYQSAPASHLGIPGPDGDDYDLGFNGLSAVSDDIKDELPPECRKAFEQALAKEKEWKGRWDSEARDGHRRNPAIDKGLILL